MLTFIGPVELVLSIVFNLDEGAISLPIRHVALDERIAVVDVIDQPMHHLDSEILSFFGYFVYPGRTDPLAGILLISGSEFRHLPPVINQFIVFIFLIFMHAVLHFLELSACRPVQYFPDFWKHIQEFLQRLVSSFCIF